MGNHEAGFAMVKTAEALINLRETTKQSAMEILEISCKPFAYALDPEFDEADQPGQPFGELLKEVFCPEFNKPEPVEEADHDAWFEYEEAWGQSVTMPFHQWLKEIRETEN